MYPKIIKKLNSKTLKRINRPNKMYSKEPTLRPRQPPIVRSQPNTNVTVVQVDYIVVLFLKS